MVVKWVDIGCISKQLKAVLRSVPVYGWFQVQAPLFVLGCYGSVGFQCVLKLVVPFGAIKGVRAKIPYAYTCMPVHAYVVVVVLSLVKSLSAFVVGIQFASLIAAVAVASGIAARQAVAGFAAKSHTSAHIGISIRSCFGMHGRG